MSAEKHNVRSILYRPNGDRYGVITAEGNIRLDKGDYALKRWDKQKNGDYKYVGDVLLGCSLNACKAWLAGQMREHGHLHLAISADEMSAEHKHNGYWYDAEWGYNDKVQPREWQPKSRFQIVQEKENAAS